MSITITGKRILAPIWGGHKPALLTSWSELKKLGFKKRDRSFGHIENENGTETPALYFYAQKNCCSLTDEQLKDCTYEWYVTTEDYADISDDTESEMSEKQAKWKIINIMNDDIHRYSVLANESFAVLEDMKASDREVCLALHNFITNAAVSCYLDLIKLDLEDYDLRKTEHKLRYHAHTLSTRCKKLDNNDALLVQSIVRSMLNRYTNLIED